MTPKPSHTPDDSDIAGSSPGVSIEGSALDEVKIVRGGDVGEDELAALVAGLAAASAAADTADDLEPAPATSQWNSRSRMLRRPVAPGPDAWRWSFR